MTSGLWILSGCSSLFPPPPSPLWAVHLLQHLPNHMLSSAKGADHLNNGMQESTDSKDQLLKPQGGKCLGQRFYQPEAKQAKGSPRSAGLTYYFCMRFYHFQVGNFSTRKKYILAAPDAKAEAPILCPPDAKNWLTGKDPDMGKDWQQEKGTTEDEMVGWHHRLSGHEFEQAPGDGEDREAWHAAVHGVTESHTWLSD